MTVGERIKMQRERIGMSQDELAKKMGYKGRSSISKIEKDTDMNITLDLVQRIAYYLNCSPLYLMGWEKEKQLTMDEVPERLIRYLDFINLYAGLPDDKRDLVDNMILALAEKK